MSANAIYRSKNYLTFCFKHRNYLDYLENGGAYMAQKFKIEKSFVSSQPKLSIPKKLESEFSKINDSFAKQLSELNSKKEFIENTMPDFASRATENLKDYKDNSLGKIETDYQTDLQKINQNKAKNIEKSSLNLQNLNETQQKSIDNLKDKAIYSGWENSSILEDGVDKINKQIDKQKEILRNQTTTDMASINLTKNLLELEKKQALSDFDLKYASKLEKEIASLSKDYATTAEGKSISNSLDLANQNIADLEEKMHLQKAKSLLAYVDTLKKQDAITFLDSERENLSKEVGSGWLNSVRNWVQARR